MYNSTIKTFEDACAFSKRDPLLLPEVSMLDTKFQKYILATYKLSIIAEALNHEAAGKPWLPNWNDSSYKYFPWFEIDASEENPSGVGFSDTGYVNWVTITSVGSRLCFLSRELALYAGEQFAELYKDFILIN